MVLNKTHRKSRRTRRKHKPMRGSAKRPMRGSAKRKMKGGSCLTPKDKSLLDVTLVTELNKELLKINNNAPLLLSKIRNQNVRKKVEDAILSIGIQLKLPTIIHGTNNEEKSEDEEGDAVPMKHKENLSKVLSQIKKNQQEGGTKKMKGGVKNGIADNNIFSGNTSDVLKKLKTAVKQLTDILKSSDYNTLTETEKDAINSFIDIIKLMITKIEENKKPPNTSSNEVSSTSTPKKSSFFSSILSNPFSSGKDTADKSKKTTFLPSFKLLSLMSTPGVSIHASDNVDDVNNYKVTTEDNTKFMKIKKEIYQKYERIKDIFKVSLKNSKNNGTVTTTDGHVMNNVKFLNNFVTNLNEKIDNIFKNVSHYSYSYLLKQCNTFITFYTGDIRTKTLTDIQKLYKKYEKPSEINYSKDINELIELLDDIIEQVKDIKKIAQDQIKEQTNKSGPSSTSDPLTSQSKKNEKKDASVDSSSSHSELSYDDDGESVVLTDRSRSSSVSSDESENNTTKSINYAKINLNKVKNILKKLSTDSTISQTFVTDMNNNITAVEQNIYYIKYLMKVIDNGLWKLGSLSRLSVQPNIPTELIQVKELLDVNIVLLNPPTVDTAKNVLLQIHTLLNEINELNEKFNNTELSYYVTNVNDIFEDIKKDDMNDVKNDIETANRDSIDHMFKAISQLTDMNSLKHNDIKLFQKIMFLLNKLGDFTDITDIEKETYNDIVVHNPTTPSSSSLSSSSSPSLSPSLSPSPSMVAPPEKEKEREGGEGEGGEGEEEEEEEEEEGEGGGGAVIVGGGEDEQKGGSIKTRKNKRNTSKKSTRTHRRHVSSTKKRKHIRFSRSKRKMNRRKTRKHN